MKKTLIFHHYNSPVGAGLSLLHILQSLDINKMEIVVCLPNMEGNLNEKILKMGYKVIYSDGIIPYMHFSGNHTPFLSIKHLNNCVMIKKSGCKIQEIIRRENPDYVVVNSMTLFWIGKIAQNCGTKTICFHRETYRKGMAGVRTAYVKKELSNYFDIVAFLSNYDISQTPKGKAQFIRITDKVEVEKYIDLEKKECRMLEKLPQNAHLVLYAGGLAKLKGAEIIVKAMVHVKTPNTKLVFLQYKKQEVTDIKSRIKDNIKILLGRNLQFKIEKYIMKNKIEDKFIFRPTTEKVERYFVACDAVVFPSIDVHQARPAYEAGIANRPFIITDFPNTREFVDETNAWIFKKGNSKELARCIDEALSGQFVVKTKNNYEKSEQNHNLKNLHKELEKMFEMVEDDRNER